MLSVENVFIEVDVTLFYLKNQDPLFSLNPVSRIKNRVNGKVMLT